MGGITQQAPLTFFAKTCHWFYIFKILKHYLSTFTFEIKSTLQWSFPETPYSSRSRNAHIKRKPNFFVRHFSGIHAQCSYYDNHQGMLSLAHRHTRENCVLCGTPICPNQQEGQLRINCNLLPLPHLLQSKLLPIQLSVCIAST